jgi:hypothetical protein
MPEKEIIWSELKYLGSELLTTFNAALLNLI